MKIIQLTKGQAAMQDRQITPDSSVVIHNHVCVKSMSHKGPDDLLAELSDTEAYPDMSDDRTADSSPTNSAQNSSDWEESDMRNERRDYTPEQQEAEQIAELVSTPAWNSRDLFCLAQIREAVGDQGERTQDELVAHIRAIVAERDRLQRNFRYVCHGCEHCSGEMREVLDDGVDLARAEHE